MATSLLDFWAFALCSKDCFFILEEEKSHRTTISSCRSVCFKALSIWDKMQQEHEENPLKDTEVFSSKFHLSFCSLMSVAYAYNMVLHKFTVLKNTSN